MASLENRTGHYHVVFRFGGRKFSRSLSTTDADEADRLRSNLEQTIRDIKSGRITLPADADIATFLLSDGKLAEPIRGTSASDVISEDARLSLHGLFDLFFSSLPESSLEDSTIATMQTHRQNIIRILGDDTIADNVDLNSLDCFVQRRSQDKGHRGRNIGVVTIRKELATLRRVWGWARKRALLAADFPDIRDIQFPKTTERPPFQTFDEITQQIERGELSDAEQAEMWESLYLKTTEIAEVLAHVREQAQHAFLHPMVITAAHTGARRSELMRSELSDIRDDVFVVREKKRKRGQQTTRRVPMSSLLKQTLDGWCQNHPGGRNTFCLGNRSSHNANLSPRPLSRDQAQHHFHQVLKGSRWHVIPGWHCLRHSFISSLASSGVDQRLIDEFVGHTTEEMRRRYRHLFPEVKQAAIRSVFG